MKKSRVIITSMIFILFLITALLSNRLKAISVEPPMYFGIAELRTTTNMGYAMGNPTTGAERIWKIVQYSNTNYNDPTEVSAYCIKADQGFSNDTLTDIYDVSYNMKTERTAIAGQNDVLDKLIYGGQYDNLLALADILYVKGVSTQAERKQLLDASGASDVIEKSDFNSWEEYYITDDEIDAVQQAAIWYFTNYQEGGQYDHYDQDTWIWYTSVDNKGVYNNLASYDPKGMVATDARAGYYREQQMVKLYRYLIDTAKSNAEKGINDDKTILTVYASNENPEAQPIMEVVKIPREFDLSLRKYITAVNDETLENTRVPNIDKTNLDNESATTAIYQHRKDPVEVKTKDIITYDITIYNEGEKAGRATEVVDQLPAGLEFVEVVSGNFEKTAYSTQDNTLYLTRKANNTTNLPAYTEGTLSSETIQIKCKVTAEGGETDKILTNIAWIAEEIDEDENVVTNEIGEDRDSEPSTITTQTKDQLVTTDNGYIGNSSNNGKDLSNSGMYFEGQQDDDDFEKVIVRAVTSIDVSKVWNDSENQDGLRTDNVVVELLINGQPSGQTITLKADEWTGSFENLPTKIDGKDVTYSVKEITSINGYTTNTKSTDSTGKSFTITNTHKIFDLSLRKYITKVGDTDITDRTPSINTNSLTTGTTATYNHKKNPVVVQTGDTVIYNLTIYNEGEKAGRATKIEDQLPTGLKFVEVVFGNFELDSYSETDNLLKLKRNSNTDNLSPYDGGATLASETIQIKCEVTAQAGSEDSILTNVAWISEAYDAEDNKTITTEKKADTDSEPGTTPNVNKDDLVTEDEGYIGNDNNSNKDLTSSQEYFEGEQDDDDFEKIVVEARTQVTVTKQWVDSNNQDNKRPSELKIALYKKVGNGVEEFVREATMTGTGNTWAGRFTDLPVYENGQKITYTVKEVNVPNGYTARGDGTEENNYTITNSYTPETTQITVTKQWNDNNNQDGKRPEDITLTLYAGDEAQDNIASVSKNGNTWTYTFSNLPKYADGEEIVYTVRETVPEGYTASDKGIANSENDYTITNSYTPETTQIVVTKNWEDNNDQDRKRPGEITLTLYAGDEAQDNIASVSKNGNTWTYTFSNLPKYADGEEIVYTVRETVPEGYTASDEGIADSTNSYTITNAYTPETTQITVTKQWNDNNNQDGKRPESVTVELYKNGVATGETKELTGDTWTASFTNLPVYENGQEITYTVKEVNVPDGYTVSGDATEENSYTITNTHTPGVTSVTVNKVWDDKDDQDGLRPDSIEVELLKNGEPTGNILTLNEENHWTGTFNNLPIKENGVEIEYTVRENTQIEGYTTEITENTESTNSIESADNTNSTENIASTDEAETTTVTYATKSMVRATSENIEPKNFTITNTHIVEEAFDLALRKFIVAVSTDETIEQSDILMNEDGTRYAREPVVDASKLNTTDENGNTITTAIYNHTKEPVLVEKNDIVVYMLRVYNEGEQDGYATEITDYLPAYLTFVDGEFNAQYGWKVSSDGRTVTTRYLENSVIAKPETDASGNQTLSYVQVPIMCQVSGDANANENITNIADITEYQDKDKQLVEDRDSEQDNVEVPSDENLPGYKNDESNQEYVPGQEDDDDFEKVIVQDFDLALRKFITKVDEEEVTTRIPEVSYNRDEEQITYNHTKDPVEVITGNVVEYTIRIYNEGDIAGYAEEVADDIPDGLRFLPENETNTAYRWGMYDKDGNITNNVEEAVEIRTDYLSKEQEQAEGENLLQAFNPDAEIGEENPDYRDIKVAFEVVEPNESDRIIVNSAQITEDSDENGNPVEDIDSIPDEWNDGEDDQDREYIKLTYFDLSLRKWVTEAIVIENGQQTVTQTGHTAEMDPEPVVKVELYRKSVNDVTVKFRYSIRVTNEGDIAGYAKEITDYIPEGLRFVAEDNPQWTDEGNNIISTRLLEDTLLQPGESAEAEVVLTWINGEDTMGQMTNIAEISEDDNDKGAEDRDSTPDNQVWGEDDIDDAPVLLSVETGQERIYYVLGFAVLGTLAGGLVLIKKFVI